MSLFESWRAKKMSLAPIIEVNRIIPDFRFDKFFNLSLIHEGGYVNDIEDPGGETKYGISKKAYPHLNIKDVSLSQAKDIYKKDYWEKGRYNLIDDDNISFKLFDIGVNAGVTTSITLLQRALRSLNPDILIAEDGKLGQKTLDLYNISDKKALLFALKSEIAGHYRSRIAANSILKKYRGGWLTRAYEDVKFKKGVI